jgi:erythromycin esterase-like protein
MSSDHGLVNAIRNVATPLVGAHTDFDLLLDRIGDARFVLLGEATHGTHEFYRIRAELTKRLILEKGFVGLAMEADWPDMERVHRFIRGLGTDLDAVDALADFQRFPHWMWRNADFLDLVGWLRAHNEHVSDPARRVGCYGLDLYSMHASIAAVLAYLDHHDPVAAQAARQRYACFDVVGVDPRLYGRTTGLGPTPECDHEVVAQLRELQRRRQQQLLARDGGLAQDEQFAAEQHARVVARAEEYFRSMHQGSTATWNLRDTHMADTLEILAEHLEQRTPRAKLVVWAHNSHVGDASATDQAQLGEINLGQLCRARRRDDTILVGFTTYTGTVTAASRWGGPAERKQVSPALSDSYEQLFHDTGVPSFVLLLDDLGEAAGGLHEARLQRAIGVVYMTRTERASHYYHVHLPAQFDAIIHVDDTRALEPIERIGGFERGELPETFPSGL